MKYCIVIFIVMLTFVSAGKVDLDIIEAFDSGEESVEVIVEFEDRSIEIGALVLNDISVEDVVDEEKVTYRFEDSVVVEISEDDLDDLSRNVNVKSIVKVEKIYALLQDSVGIINASSTWGLRSSGVNLTGVKQSVCVIDSGINYSHPDLAGSYLGGYDFVDDDSDPMDGFGHGTHVAGIIAASGGISGVAPGVGIVAIRVLDNSGSGSSLDLVSAIDWCVNNASQFNISVISMSLGCNETVDGYASSCDANVGCLNSLIADAVNVAVLNNISVVAASGNFGSSERISSPACIKNVIAVSSVNKTDSISWFSDRNSLVNLLAPGSGINSTRWNPSGTFGSCGPYSGNYMACSGTSMAAPMVSGIIALINQYLGLGGRSRTPSQIESILNDTGLRINDVGSGLNFSIVDAYAAVTSLDVDAPNVTLVSPTDDTVNANVNQTFTCNATDWQLANVTLSVWNSSGVFYNATNNFSGVANESSFNVTDMLLGDYEWNCLSSDALGYSAFASTNSSLTVIEVFTALVSPVNESYSNVNNTNFSCRVTSYVDYVLSNVTFYLWNTSDLVYNLTSDISGIDNTTTFNYSFVDKGSYSWNCLGVNNGSNESWGDSNYSFVFDSTAPVISSLTESVSVSGATISWDTNEDANSSVSMNTGSWSNSSSYETSHSVVVSGLSAGTAYSYVVTSCDQAGNCVNVSDGFTTSVISSGSSPGGGSSRGGGGSVTASSVPVIYEVSVAGIQSGFTRRLKKDDGVEFNVFGSDGERHSVSVDEVGVDYVELTIKSDPISLKLGVGQSAKLNLTSPTYYDLFVKLNAIVGDEAELTIQLINESIEPNVVELVSKEVVETEVVGDYLWIVVVLIVVLVAIVFVVLTKNRKELKGSRRKKGNGKKT